MVEHWGRPACPGVRIPGAIPVFTRMMPCPSRGRSRAPTQRVSPRSVTPHHRSASPFPVPSIPLRAGHPKRASRLRGNDSLLTQEPPSGVVPPLPRRDRNTRSRLFRCPSEQMPHSLGTCGHEPSCSLPSVVNRWLQRKRWYWPRVANPLLSQCCPASHHRNSGYTRGRLMLKSVRVGHWILYRGNAQFRLSISLPVTASDHEVKAAFLTRTGQREPGAAAALCVRLIFVGWYGL
jgi:hypothetical protein